MKVCGIIFEYNPFHNGHVFLIDKIREKGYDAIVAVMSPNFVQRGLPAIVDKAKRAEMALNNGVDLVLELPALWACSSAYYFALGGLSVLNGTGIVDSIGFGAETPNLSLLKGAAHRLACPSDEFKKHLAEYLDRGLSFVEAQAKALSFDRDFSFSPSMSNDILAVSYLQVMEEYGFNLNPVVIERSGEGYSGLMLPEDGYASAGALRQAITLKTDSSELKRFMPCDCVDLLSDSNIVNPRDWNDSVLSMIKRATLEDIRKLPDVSEGLENRFIESADLCDTYDEFMSLMKTKRYPYTRLSRMLCHLFLNITKDDYSIIKEGVPYIRVVGQNEKGRELLGIMRKTATLPVTNCTKKTKEIISEGNKAAKICWDIENRAGSLYAMLSKTSCNSGNPNLIFNPIVK